MKRKLGLIGVLYAAILAAIAGYFFRTVQLSGGSSVPVVAFSVLMVLVFALAAVSLEKHAAYAEVYSPCRQDLAFSLLGAAGQIVVPVGLGDAGKRTPARIGKPKERLALAQKTVLTTVDDQFSQTHLHVLSLDKGIANRQKLSR